MKGNKKSKKISRRDFLKISGAAGVGFALGFKWMEEGVAAIPASKGYLLVDTRKCAACQNCMLICSLVHEGFSNPSLARIQILQDSFLHFPTDITIEQCRQCLSPLCLKACVTGALHVDARHGNVRAVDPKKCVGCMACIKACPYPPARVVWNFEDGRAQKCDLCADTPFWDEKSGPGGKQACIVVCPYNAIKYTEKIPVQKGEGGYKVRF